MPRPLALVTTLALVLTACTATGTTGGSPDGDATGDVATGEDATGGDAAAATTASDGPSTPATSADCSPTTGEGGGAATTDAPFPWDDADAAVLDGFETAEVIPGGPPPDGIAPVDDPCVVAVSAADQWLADDESVMVVEVGDETRAYPLAIMTQHEIVNDVLGGIPLAVTYCPLCNSGLAFERVVDTGGLPALDGQRWEFGTSGRLLHSNLVMYDRQTRTLWSQFTGTALWGDPAVVGTELTRVPTQVLAWSTFREAHPDGTVLGRDSVPGRSYGRNPYPGYEDAPSQFLFRGELDDRLDPDERVVGLGGEGEGTAVAVPLAVLREVESLTVPVGDDTVTVVWTPGQASALDAGTVADGRDVGQTGAFLVEGLEPVAEGRFRDPATGAVHDVTGRTVEGDAPALEPVPLDDTFWFVWFAFRPHTAIAG